MTGFCARAFGLASGAPPPPPPRARRWAKRLVARSFCTRAFGVRRAARLAPAKRGFRGFAKLIVGGACKPPVKLRAGHVAKLPLAVATKRRVLLAVVTLPVQRQMDVFGYMYNFLGRFVHPESESVDGVDVSEMDDGSLFGLCAHVFKPQELIKLGLTTVSA